MPFAKIKSVIFLLLFITLTTAFTCQKGNNRPDPVVVDTSVTNLPPVVGDSTDTSHEVVVHNCDGLITDTAGTNEQVYIIMANAFTPNGDGNNDTYHPIFKNIASFDFTVYDANDKVVFATTTFGQGWAPATQYTSNQTFYYSVQGVTKENHKLGTCGEVRLLTCVPRDSLKYVYFTDQCAPDGTFSLPTADRIGECP